MFTLCAVLNAACEPFRSVAQPDQVQALPPLTTRLPAGLDWIDWLPRDFLIDRLIDYCATALTVGIDWLLRDCSKKWLIDPYVTAWLIVKLIDWFRSIYIGMPKETKQRVPTETFVNA